MMPRQYAAVILKYPRRRRRELLDRVPEIWQGMVQSHLEIADSKARFKEKQDAINRR
jgi:hypothetical protein